ncbi:MAG: CHASE2 domain-containing protein [Bacteroidaceae bacterium]
MLGKHLAITVLSYMIMGFFALMLSIKSFDPLSNALRSFSFTDIYYQILSQTTVPDTSRVVTIVDMTQIYRRGQMAQVLQDIQAASPKVVGIDVVFDLEKDDFEGNDSLIRIAQDYGNMVFSMKSLDFDEDNGGYTKEIHSFLTNYVDVKEGASNVPRGGQYDVLKREIMRRILSMGRELPSLPALVASEYTGRELWKEDEATIGINFSPKVFDVLSPEEVRQHPELIEGRVVMLGAMYEDSDTHWTPIGKIPGVELLAYGIQTMLEKREVRHLPSFLTYLISFFLSLAYCYFIVYFKHTTASSDSMFVRFIVGSAYVVSMITFLFTTLLLFVAFLVFALSDISVNLALAISSMAFMGTSINMYKALWDYFSNMRMGAAGHINNKVK